MSKAVVIYNSISPSLVDTAVSVTDTDTYASAVLVNKTLKRLGYQTQLLGLAPGDINQLRDIDADVVFNLCEWSGRDYPLGVKVIQLLEKRRAPFTGGNSKSFRWSGEKISMKKMFDRLELPTPAWTVYQGQKLTIPVKLPFPVLVKPAWEHCSIGVEAESYVADSPTLKKTVEKWWSRFYQPILVEEFIDGDEYQVWVLENRGRPWVLPPCETIYRRDLSGPALVTFEENWLVEATSPKIDCIRAADVSCNLIKKVMALAGRTYRLMGCQGYVRIDMRLKRSQPYILEVNVNPGLGWDSQEDLTIAASAAGLDFKQVVAQIVSAANYRHSYQYDAAIV